MVISLVLFTFQLCSDMKQYFIYIVLFFSGQISQTFQFVGKGINNESGTTKIIMNAKCVSSFLGGLHQPFLHIFVKLHSDLRILTQLQLVGVGGDFVFPLEQGRKKKNPHLGSSRECDSTCLKYLVGVWKVFGNCLEGVWQVS